MLIFFSFPKFQKYLRLTRNLIHDLTLAKNDSFIDKLKILVYKTPIVLSVCTGALLLAKTGFLDGKEATTNKTAYKEVTDHASHTNPGIKWQCAPRWIGNIDKASQTGYMTSGGVAAGIDMMLAVIRDLFGEQIVRNVQNKMEYTWQYNPELDPFVNLCPRD